MSVVVRGGRVIDPASGFDAVADVRIRDGRIEAVVRAGDRERGGSGGRGGADAVDDMADAAALGDAAGLVDATGLVVAPGFVDPHAHLSEPGWEHRETIATGAMAAAAGGYTAVCAMPDTDPVVDDPASVGFVVAAGRRARGARVHPVAAVSEGREGRQLTEFGEVTEAGAVALSDAGRAVRSSMLMRLALEYARTFGVPILAHPEDAALARGGVMNEGVVSTRMGLRGKPSVAERIGAARDLALAGFTGGRLHLQRVSTAGAAELVRRAKAEGSRVTAEATPHHLLLSDGLLAGYGTEYKVDPPLRTRADVDALQRALADGTIDAIATDHAPRTYDEKEQAFDDAPFGAVGFETAFAVLHTRLVLAGAIDLPTLIARMSLGPARALGLTGGTLAPGQPADVVLIDPEARWTIDPARFLSKCRNTPFGGEPVTGRVVQTLVAGRTVWAAANRRSGPGRRTIRARAPSGRAAT